MLKHADHMSLGEEHLARDALAILVAARIDVVHLDGHVAAVVRVVRQVYGARAAPPTSLMITYLPIFSGKAARPC